MRKIRSRPCLVRRMAVTTAENTWVLITRSTSSIRDPANAITAPPAWRKTPRLAAISTNGTTIGGVTMPAAVSPATSDRAEIGWRANLAGLSVSSSGKSSTGSVIQPTQMVSEAHSENSASAVPCNVSAASM